MGGRRAKNHPVIFTEDGDVPTTAIYEVFKAVLLKIQIFWGVTALLIVVPLSLYAGL
jgi:hypothetical protein